MGLFNKSNDFEGSEYLGAIKTLKAEVQEKDQSIQELQQALGNQQATIRNQSITNQQLQQAVYEIQEQLKNQQNQTNQLIQQYKQEVNDLKARLNKEKVIKKKQTKTFYTQLLSTAETKNHWISLSKRYDMNLNKLFREAIKHYENTISP